jgi:hypothetical protein
MYSLSIGDQVYSCLCIKHVSLLIKSYTTSPTSYSPASSRKHTINHQGFISNLVKEAFKAFQVKLNNKQLNLSNLVRRSIPNSYDTMTTLPVESINSHIKKRICALPLYNLSCSLMMITDGMYKFDYTNQYVMISLWQFYIPFHIY